MVEKIIWNFHITHYIDGNNLAVR